MRRRLAAVLSRIQVHARVEAVDRGVQRVAFEREHAVVDARPQRPGQRDLHAAAGVEADVRLRDDVPSSSR